MKIGLVGTGHWAHITAAPALADSPAIAFDSVWGRDPVAARALAARYGVIACEDYDDFLSRVDAVAFAIPPTHQPALALRAIRAGKHVLLEKPTALEPSLAEALADAAAAAGVVGLVNFTSRFDPAMREWFSEATADGWSTGAVEWVSDDLSREASPWAVSTWRHVAGPLWDIGPHALSILCPFLGSVTGAQATRGSGDLIHVAFRHQGGRTSVVTLSQKSPAAAAGGRVSIWGEGGRTAPPTERLSSIDSYRVALAEMVELICAGDRIHPCDLAFGAEIVRALAMADLVTKPFPKYVEESTLG